MIEECIATTSQTKTLIILSNLIIFCFGYMIAKIIYSIQEEKKRNKK